MDGQWEGESLSAAEKNGSLAVTCRSGRTVLQEVLTTGSSPAQGCKLIALHSEEPGRFKQTIRSRSASLFIYRWVHSVSLSHTYHSRWPDTGFHKTNEKLHSETLQMCTVLLGRQVWVCPALLHNRKTGKYRQELKSPMTNLELVLTSVTPYQLGHGS